MGEWLSLDQGEMGRPAPSFSLTTNSGGAVSLQYFRGRRNLVLFFAHVDGCEPCRHLLVEFACRYDEYQLEDTDVLAILPAPPHDLPGRKEFPFPVLSDPDGETRRDYAGLLPGDPGDDALLFVLDRFGAPYAAMSGEDLDAPDAQQEILNWIGFIGLQCPE